MNRRDIESLLIDSQLKMVIISIFISQKKHIISRILLKNLFEIKKYIFYQLSWSPVMLSAVNLTEQTMIQLFFQDQTRSIQFCISERMI